MIVIILAVAIVLIAIVVFATNNDSNSGDAVIDTGDDTAAGNVLTNDTDTKDDAEWYQEYEEYEPKVRRVTKKWDADVKFRKERNSKAKNSKKKGNFKPWQH